MCRNQDRTCLCSLWKCKVAIRPQEGAGNRDLHAAWTHVIFQSGAAQAEPGLWLWGLGTVHQPLALCRTLPGCSLSASSLTWLSFPHPLWALGSVKQPKGYWNLGSSTQLFHTMAPSPAPAPGLWPWVLWRPLRNWLVEGHPGSSSSLPPCWIQLQNTLPVLVHFSNSLGAEVLVSLYLRVGR